MARTTDRMVVNGTNYEIMDATGRQRANYAKRAIKEIPLDHAEVLSATWEQGSIDSHGVNVDVNNRIRFVGKLKIKEGWTIFAIADNGYELGFNLYDSSETFKVARGWMEYDSLQYGSGEDQAVYYRMIAKHTDNSNIAVSEKTHITFVTIPNTDYVNFINNIDKTQRTVVNAIGLPNNGYLQDDGTPHEPTYEIEKYSDKTPISKGQYVLQYDVDFPSGKTPWIRLNFFDANNVHLGCETYARENKKNTIELNVTYDDVAFLVVSCRTFNVECHITLSDLFINYLNNKIESNKQNNFSKSYSTVFVSREGMFPNTIENSADGIRSAKMNGYDYIRADVQFTSDGVPVCFHDETLGSVLTVYDENGDTITNGDKISTYTYDTLATYHFGSLTNELLTVDECAALCKKYGLGLVLEVKEPTIPTEQNMSDAYDAVAKNGMAPNTEWDVYTAQTAGYIQEIDDTADIGYISETISTTTIDEAAALKTGKNKVYFCAYATKFSSFTDALHVYGARNGVMFKMGSAYTVAEINTYRKFEKIEVANVANPAYALAMYDENNV